MAIYEEKLIHTGVADGDNDISPCESAHSAEAAQANKDHLVSTIKLLLDVSSGMCVESKDVSNEELTSTHASECGESLDSLSTAPSGRSQIDFDLSDAESKSSSESVSMSLGSDLQSKPAKLAAAQQSCNADFDFCAALPGFRPPPGLPPPSDMFPLRPESIALQKRIWEAARAPQMEFMQRQMAQWHMTQWRAVQMVQWQHAAFGNQAGQEPKPAVQWKEGDTFEVESAFVTCDKTKTRVEPRARGTVTRIRGGGPKWMMSVKFDNMVNCKWISAKDCHKLNKTVQCQAALW